ncbi:biotin biosynthesis protein BioY [Ligilactobacillus salitolerans]|uniref:Biotin transporter n=1 Tax=Ligilactobacillus salitolerans TaxID=1808352 RepID=A0A401IQ21_9LACO|nr:biotin transporter BioY [Ligilactobacillus salitolerans]GBG93626.1 biotin biosynthesis protein BioY [Ligilactobacillus salitolerans]
MHTKDLTLVSLMTAIIIILGLIPGIPLGVIPVPIVLQNCGIMLAGLLLGTKRGTLAVFLLLLLTALGLPVLSGGRGGLPIFIGPTAGYLFGWLVTPALINLGLKFVPQRGRILWQLLSVWVAGVLCADLIGTVWLTFQSHIPFLTALVSNLAFLPGDTLKVILAYTVAKALSAQHFSQNALL